MRCCNLRTWQTPATAYPIMEAGTWAIAREKCSTGYYHAYGTHPEGVKERYEYFRATRRLQITSLTEDGRTWMVDDPPHWWAMQAHARRLGVTGANVVCAGLGLGLIVHALDATPCKSITVVERSREVIEMIGPMVPARKLRIVHADWNEWKPGRRKVDAVLYDLLVGDGRELLPNAICATIDIIRRFGNVPRQVHGYPQKMLEVSGMAASL